MREISSMAFLDRIATQDESDRISKFLIDGGDVPKIEGMIAIKGGWITESPTPKPIEAK